MKLKLLRRPIDVCLCWLFEICKCSLVSAKDYRGVEFQQSNEYLINEGYIVGGDLLCISKISMLIDRIGTRLMGEDPRYQQVTK